MSVSRQCIESFFRTLLMGDFEENQNTAAQVIGGLISLIPVLDQVMDVRDVSGSLYNVNARGGFKNASTDQVVSFGFAAFGVIPEVGSAFKTVFKPLWKERRAAKGAVNSGVQAMEAMLGMGKGGTARWIKTLDWPGRTQQAIALANSSLAACIELTEFIATAGGWKDWLLPDSVQAMAKEMLPGLKALRGKLAEPIQRASLEIKAFLEDLLGEQAAAIAMSVGERAVQASAVAGTRSRSGHNAAAAKPTGHVPARQETKKVGAQPRTEASKGNGPVHATVQATRKGLQDMAAREKGLVGEHVADYHELRRLGGAWVHDKAAGSWSPDSVHKLNADKRPVNLSLADLPKVNQPGIDAVWQHGTSYTVTEAKASASIAAAYGFGKYKVKKGLIPVVSGLNPDQELLHYLLSDSSDKGGTGSPMVQMSHDWVEDRATREGLTQPVKDAIKAKRYARRTVLVTFESAGAVDHGEALADLHLGKPAAELHPHSDHGITREWDAAAIDAVVKARGTAQKAKGERTPSTQSDGEPEAKPKASRRNSSKKP